MQPRATSRDDPLHPDGPVPLPRAAAAVLAGACTLQFGPVQPVLLVPLLLLAVAVACLFPLLTQRVRVWARSGFVLTFVATVAGVGVMSGAALAVDFGVPAWAAVLLALVMLVSAATAVWAGPARARTGLVVLLVAFAALTVLTVLRAEIVIDVEEFLRGGIDALLHGTSPYAITIPSPYDAAGTQAFYGPGVVVDGVVQYGFPYLPTGLLLDVPAYVLGDPRWMHLAAVLVTTALAWRLATDRIGRAVALLLVCGGTASTVVLCSWVEPLMGLLLALTVLAMRSSRAWVAVPLGLLFASKQYAVSYAPALLTVARSRGWRTVWLAAAVGALVVVPFVVWDPRAFVRSAVEFQLVQPFRSDAVSLLPGLSQLLGGLPGWVLEVSPFVGLVVSALVAWRTRPGPTAFALGVGLSLLVTVLTSKVGFMNYYSFIAAALVLATVTWTTDDPVATHDPGEDDSGQTREPSSQGSRGDRGISLTR